VARIGHNIRHARRRSGLTQDELATRVRALGGELGRAAVAALERGSRLLSESELVLLCLALRTSPNDLLVDCSAELTLMPVRPEPGRLERDQELAARASKGEAEQKAARNLGVTSLAISTAAIVRWGRSLTDERDYRLQRRPAEDARPRSLQAQRGHITRQLLRELAATLGRQHGDPT